MQVMWNSNEQEISLKCIGNTLFCNFWNKTQIEIVLQWNLHISEFCGTVRQPNNVYNGESIQYNAQISGNCLQKLGENA